jgi:hypothetical protein
METMDQCPHCGAESEGPKCSNCGQTLDALPEYQSGTARHGTTPPSRTELPDGAERQPDYGPQPRTESADGEARPEAVDESETDRPLGGTLSRRALLGGAGASVALLGVGGAGWMYLQRGGAGDDIVQAFVTGIATNNWSQIERLYHEDSTVITEIEQSDEFNDYEGFLRSQNALGTWEDIKPELDGIEEFYHATEVTEESVEELNVQFDAGTVDVVDEVRSVAAFLAVEVGALSGDREDATEYYKNGTKNRPLTCTLVLSEGRWHLWTVRGFARFR